MTRAWLTIHSWAVPIAATNTTQYPVAIGTVCRRSGLHGTFDLKSWGFEVTCSFDEINLAREVALVGHCRDRQQTLDNVALGCLQPTCHQAKIAAMLARLKRVY